MKIYRSELVSNIQDKLFEISVDQFSLDEVEFHSNIIEGVMSVDCMSNGYHIKGYLNVPYKLICDRCLKDFQDLRKVKFDFILTDDSNLLYDESDDLIYFPESEIEYDVNPLFEELIQLELQMKILCKSGCKGLCLNCGSNLNDESCSCDNVSIDDPWEKLKSISG